MPTGEWVIIHVGAILFLAALIRSTFGFGEALVAVPLLSLIAPISVAAPVSMLISLTVALIALAQDWRSVHFRSARSLVFSTIAGIPLGLLLLKWVPSSAAKTGLAIVVIAFSLYSLLHRRDAELKNEAWTYLFGFGAGVLGAYGMNGPPLAVYGSLRGWPPAEFRATLQGYFLPASLLSLVGYWLAGLWTSTVGSFYLWSLPAIILATFLGRSLNQRMNTRTFTLYVHLGLIVIGAVLLWQSTT